MTSATSPHPTVRDTLAALRAKYALALSPPVPGLDQPPATMQPAQDVSAPPPRLNARSVPHRPQEVRWTTICRTLAKHGPMTAAQLAPLVGMCKPYMGRNLHRMRVAGLVAVSAKVMAGLTGRATLIYDLAVRHVGPPAHAVPRWGAAIVALAVERGSITRKDLGEALAVDRPTANRKLRKLAALGLLAIVGTNVVRGGPREKIYGPAAR